jgi:hypothetical protein
LALPARFFGWLAGWLAGMLAGWDIKGWISKSKSSQNEQK